MSVSCSSTDVSINHGCRATVASSSARRKNFIVLINPPFFPPVTANRVLFAVTARQSRTTGSLIIARQWSFRRTSSRSENTWHSTRPWIEQMTVCKPRYHRSDRARLHNTRFLVLYSILSSAATVAVVQRGKKCFKHFFFCRVDELFLRKFAPL